MTPQNEMQPGLGWAVLQQAIRLRYPQVRSIGTATLAEWLAQPQRQLPRLLDTRSYAEFAVSHLQGAQRLDPDEMDLNDLGELPQDTPIVTYCSVGYRSAKVCDRLQAAGYTNVVNLAGSIFQWANEGRPVYRDGREVRQVHPYSALWGVLLKPELHAYKP